MALEMGSLDRRCGSCFTYDGGRVKASCVCLTRPHGKHGTGVPVPLWNIFLRPTSMLSNAIGLFWLRMIDL
jgi:hypothetical protein